MPMYPVPGVWAAVVWEVTPLPPGRWFSWPEQNTVDGMPVPARKTLTTRMAENRTDAKVSAGLGLFCIVVVVVHSTLVAVLALPVVFLPSVWFFGGVISGRW